MTTADIPVRELHAKATRPSVMTAAGDMHDALEAVQKAASSGLFGAVLPATCIPVLEQVAAALKKARGGR